MADVLQEQWALDLAVRIEVMRRPATIRFRCLKHDGLGGPDTDATFPGRRSTGPASNG